MMCFEEVHVTAQRPKALLTELFLHYSNDNFVPLGAPLFPQSSAPTNPGASASPGDFLKTTYAAD